MHPVRAVRRCVPHRLHHHRPCRPDRRGGRVSVRAPARRGPVHSLRALHQSLPTGRARRWCTPRRSPDDRHDRARGRRPGAGHPRCARAGGVAPTTRRRAGPDRAERRVAIDVPPPPARHAAWPGPAVVLELLPAPLPGQDPGPRAADALLVPPRLHLGGAVRDPHRDGRRAHVLLHACGRVGLRRHAAAQDGRGLRPAHPQRPPVVRAPDGGRRVPPPRPRLLRRRLQEAPRVQLGHRGRLALPHPRVVVHRLPAAVGPAGVLGRDRRHQPRALRADRRAPPSSPC